MLSWAIWGCLVAVIAAQTCTQVENCSSCKNPDLTCLACPVGMGMRNDATKGCIDCPSNCAVCATESKSKDDMICSECAGGYILDKEKNMCVGCPGNCAICEFNEDKSATLCITCRSRFALTAAKTCLGCAANCENCRLGATIGSTVCTSCDSLYVLNSASITTGTQCLRCPTTCTSCSGIPREGSAAISRCTSCTPETYLSSDICEICGVDGCIACGTDGSTCSACNTQYRLDQQSCQACPAFCLKCSSSDGDDVCNTCLPFYTVASDNKVCQDCESNCLECTASACTKCRDGYFIYGRKCLAIPANCVTHGVKLDKAICTTCKPGYSVVNDQCQACTVQNCNNCHSDVSVCEGCVAKYFSAGIPTNITSCTACTSNCKNCSADGPKCNDGQCDDRYYRDANEECKKCTSNCGSCNGAGPKCDDKKCDIRFYRDSNQECKACPSNCNNCTKSDECADNSCDPGYYKTNKLCSVCTPNCKKCADDSGGKCDGGQCKEGFYREDTGGTCVACSSNCVACTETGCILCKTNYGLNNKKCSRCSSKCLTCITDSKVCTQCVSDAVLNNDRCTPCSSNCATCTLNSDSVTTTCTLCDPGYGNDNGVCVACPRDCHTCSRDEDSGAMVCSLCFGRYYLEQDTQCTACPSNCKECSVRNGAVYCTTCVDRFALNELGKCDACPGNCQTCSSTGGTIRCSACDSAFALSSDRSSCTGCGTATGVTNCGECTNVDNTGDANCTSCFHGFTFRDKNKFDTCSPCSDVTGCADKCIDEPYVCQGESACDPGYSLDSEGRCTYLCYSCGDGQYVDDKICGPESSSMNYTTVSCPTGRCWTEKMTKADGTVLSRRGCLAEQCTKDSLNVACFTDNGDEECRQCCEGDLCNSEKSGVASVVAALLAIVAAFIATQAY